MSRRRKILIVMGFALAAAILIPVIHHYQLRTAVDAYIAELKAKGEPMELAQVIPPPVPPGQNAAPLISNALSQIYLERNYTNSIIFNNPPGAMNRAIPGKEMVGWHQPAIHTPNGTWPPNLTNSWGDLGAQLAERRDDLNDFRKLVENPTFDFAFDYSDSKIFIPTLAPHLSQIKMAIQWLEASEYYNLHQDKTAEACTDVRAMLAFVKGQTEERFEISQLVRFAIAQMIANATWDVLQTTNVSDENLAQLQQDWESLEFVHPLKNAFLFERVCELQTLNDLRQSPTNLSWWLGSVLIQKGYGYEKAGEGAAAKWVFMDKSPFWKKMINNITVPWDKAQWQWFWSYTDECHGLPMWQTVIDGTQIMGTNHSFQSVQSFVSTSFAPPDLDAMTNNPYAILSQNAHSQLTAMRKAAAVEVTRNVVITAIALKRYELRHQQLPATLDQLTPDLLKAVPIDCMDGQPLRYRPKADGTFLLYSVGENGKDDDGDPSLENGVQSSNYYWQNPRALDWVWPQPATPEEVQKYYDEQAGKSK